MKKGNHIVQGKGKPELSAPRRKSGGYTGAVCEGCAGARPESEGETDGSVVGCNANNGRASARTSNCNNHAGNGNDNYAGAFAVVSEKKKEGLASCAASTKTTEGSAATGAQGRRDYGELPFWGDANAESDASATEKEEAVKERTKTANRRRKLKNMRALLTDRTLIEMAFDQRRLCHSTEGSEEIVEFFKLVERGEAELHQHLHVGKEGNKVFFVEYHTTAEEACDIICKMLGI